MAEGMARALERRHQDLFVVVEIDYSRRRLRGRRQGRDRECAWSAMSPRLRRITVHEGPAGLKPPAVFVGHGSLMLTSSSWDHVRYQAWDRMAAVRGDERAPQLPTKPWPFHGLRHAFALRLLDYLMRRSAERERAEKRADMATPGEHLAFDPLLIVSRCLGHNSPAVTYEYLRYLEDPMTYVAAAFEQWAANDGDTCAEIAVRALQARKEAGHAAKG
ncbi:hypothetical protein ACFXPY_44785 [Streptomyces sp. NPDC059153]|uniref:hypothetical protein n=1 Tax=Streptomyces sp. NPDC059153 TaxID=3346743 RepID=UPI0036B7EE81